MTLAFMETGLEDNPVCDLSTHELIEVLIYRLCETNGLDMVDAQRRDALILLLVGDSNTMH